VDHALAGTAEVHVKTAGAQTDRQTDMQGWVNGGMECAGCGLVMEAGNERGGGVHRGIDRHVKGLVIEGLGHDGWGLMMEGARYGDKGGGRGYGSTCGCYKVTG
jgi:hypothetical protein